MSSRPSRYLNTGDRHPNQGVFLAPVRTFRKKFFPRILGFSLKLFLGFFPPTQIHPQTPSSFSDRILVCFGRSLRETHLGTGPCVPRRSEEEAAHDHDGGDQRHRGKHRRFPRAQAASPPSCFGPRRLLIVAGSGSQLLHHHRGGTLPRGGGALRAGGTL